MSLPSFQQEAATANSPKKDETTDTTSKDDQQQIYSFFEHRQNRDSIETSPLSDSSDSAIEEEIAAEERKTFLEYLLLLIFGSALVASPAIYFIVKDSTTLPDLNPVLDYNSLLANGQLRASAETVRWQFQIILVTRIHGVCSEKFRGNLEKIPAAKKWIWFMFTTLLSLAFYALLFNQFQQVARWNSMLIFLSVLLIFSFLVLVQRITMLNIAENFHRQSYQDRIDEVKAGIKVLDRLRKSLAVSNLAGVFDFQDQKKNLVDSEYTTERSFLGMLKRPFKSNDYQKTSAVDDESEKIKVVVSPTIVAIGKDDPKDEKDEPIQKNVRFNSDGKGSNNIERKKTEMSKNSQFMRNSSSDLHRKLINARIDKGILIGGEKLRGHKSLDLLSEKNGLRLACKLFAALCQSDKDYIYIDQFYPYFDSEAEAMEAFQIFDNDRNGSLTLKEMKHSILRIYRERRNLFHSLSDLSQALGRLNQIGYVFSISLTLFLSLPILGISLTAILPFTSILVALSFIFGSAASSTFNCIVFLFIHHPFDTGDRVMIDGCNLVVSELNLLTTVFVQVDGKKVYIPNTVLATKMIYNIRRSGDMSEGIDFQIAFDTPEEKLDMLEKKMCEFLEENNRDYGKDTSIYIQDMESTNKLKLSLWLTYKGNWQDGARRVKRRTAFVRALRKTLMELGIEYVLPPQKLFVDIAGQ